MATRYDRFGTSYEPEKTKIIVGGYEEKQADRTKLYIVLSIIAVILILGVIIYFVFFATRCRANPLFTQDQLDAIKRPLTGVDDFCSEQTSETSCTANVYYIYTDTVDVADDARTWSYNEVQADVSGMRYWGTLENICYWQ